MSFKHDHTHLRCRDLEASINYYQDFFGGEVLKRLEVAGITLVRMAVGDIVLALSPRREGDPKPNDGPGWGAYELGFLVADIHRVCGELKDKGAHFIREPYQVRPGVTIAFVQAPDDMQIEILQREEGV